MTTDNLLLPKEAVALVQHIELNRAGWWEKSIHRLILATVWLSDKPPNADAIRSAMESTFKLPLTIQKITSALDLLASRKLLLRLPSNAYKIPEEHRAEFEKEIAESEHVEFKAKELFSKLSAKCGVDADLENLWAVFEQEFLGPLIKEVGANAYRLIAGEKMTIDRSLVDQFLRRFPFELHEKLRALVTEFLDPKLPEVCGYINRLLHARFCVEASGLSEDVLVKINASIGKHIRFVMFVDTNFLFSLLELHENPSNAAAQELRELIAQLKGNPRIELVITSETIEEAKGSIAYTKGQLTGLPAGGNFTQAALRARFSGMAERFLIERVRRNGNLTADEWFDPYLNDFLQIARSKGVELFNQKLEGYSTRQDVIDDIHDVLKFEENLPEARRKSYPKIAHDMVLWHFVSDKRSAYVESPIDACYWVMTVDFRLIGFDEHKQKISNSSVPLCIHPTSLIQILQFWVPRTKEFEEAMLGSLRLPFLFQEFDAEGEQTSLKILKGIGRFEGSEGLSQETITHVMLNDGLRSRLKEGQSDDVEVALIRDALVEEMRLSAEAEKNKAKQLEQEVQKRDSELAALAAQKQAAENESAETKREKAEAEAVAKKLILSQGEELDAVKERLRKMEGAELRRTEKEDADRIKRSKRKALGVYFVSLVFLAAITATITWKTGLIFPWYSKILGPIPAMALVAIIVFVFGHLLLELSICRKPEISTLWPFRQVKRFSRLLWAIVLIGFAGGVGGNIYANWIQKNIEADAVTSVQKELQMPNAIYPEDRRDP